MLRREWKGFSGDRVGTDTHFKGGIDTPMYREVRKGASQDPVPGCPIPRLGYPQELANVVAFLLSNEGTYVTGAAWTVDGGTNA